MILDRSLLAIDIGASSVKVVGLSGSRKKSLTTLGLELLPPHLVGDGTIRNQGAVAEVIGSLLERLRLLRNGRKCAIALGGSPSMVRRITVDKSEINTLSDTIYHQAEQSFGIDLRDLYFRYQPLSRVPDKSGKIPVLLAGARREVVEQHIAILNSLRLKTAVVDCEALCLANMFEFNYPNVPILFTIINMGASFCQFILVGQGQYLHTQEIRFGGEELSHQITEVMGIDFDNAETLKVSASESGHEIPLELKNIFNAAGTQLCAEIQGIISSCHDQLCEGKEPLNIHHMFLTGGGARLAGFDSQLSQTTNVPVQIMNPFHRVQIPRSRFDLEYLRGQGHLFAVAVGLALRYSGDDLH